MPEKGDDHVAHRCGRLHVAIVSPGQHQHVRDEINKQRCDSKPDGARGEHLSKNAEELGGRMKCHWPYFLHSGTEQHVAERAEDDNQQDQKIRLEVPTGMSVVVMRRAHGRHILALFHRKFA